MNNWQWRDYQNDCFKSIIKGFQKGVTQQLIVQATGLGKRSQAVFTAGWARNCLFLAHTEELIEQAHRDFVRWYGESNVGVIRGNKMEIDRQIVVSSPLTLVNHLDKIPFNHFEMVQVDEVHHYMAKSYYKAVSYFQSRMRLGWTATPRRLDGLSLLDMFQEKTFEYSILRGIEQGYLAELKGIRIRTNVDLSKAKKSMGEFNTSDLEALVDIPERNKLIVDSYEKHAAGRQFIAFAVDTRHALNITEMFRERGHKVELISSDVGLCPDREDRIRAFESKRLIGLVNVNILTEGFDYRDVGAILDASPTLSETRYMQRVGRGTRIKSPEYQEKFGNVCIVMDFVDISTRHKLVNSFELDKSLPALEKVFVDTAQRDKLFEKERQRREVKVIHVTDKDEYFDFTKPPKVEISKSSKMMEEATPAQIKLLQSLGLWTQYDQDGNEIEYTKLIVAELLQGEITPEMKRNMIYWKYNPNGATIAQYLAISRMRRLQREEAELEALRQKNTQAMIDRIQKGNN